MPKFKLIAGTHVGADYSGKSGKPTEVRSRNADGEVEVRKRWPSKTYKTGDVIDTDDPDGDGPGIDLVAKLGANKFEYVGGTPPAPRGGHRGKDGRRFSTQPGDPTPMNQAARDDEENEEGDIARQQLHDRAAGGRGRDVSAEEDEGDEGDEADEPQVRTARAPAHTTATKGKNTGAAHRGEKSSKR
jgi:hypothetical protein